MEHLKKKSFRLKIIIKVIEVFMIIPLAISLYFTCNFMTGGVDGLMFYVRLAIAFVFDGTKTIIILVSSYLKKYFTIELKAFLSVLLIVSICFTINAFLNNMDQQRENSKVVTQEYKDYEKELEKKEIEITKAENEVIKEKESRDKNTINLADYMGLRRIEIDKQYEPRIKRYEDKVDKLKKDKKEIIKPKKFEYKEINESINTKLLDPITDNYKIKVCIISLFFGIFIELLAIVLGRVRNQLYKVLDELQIEINKLIKIDEASRHLTSSNENTENKKSDKSYKHNNTKKVIDLQKKEKPLNEICLYIISKTMENNQKVPPIRHLVENSNYNQKDIIKAREELRASNKIFKDGRFDYLSDERNVVNG